MAKVINLRTIRKQKTREKMQVLKKQSAQPAGIKKPERDRVLHMNAFTAKTLDGHKREPED